MKSALMMLVIGMFISGCAAATNKCLKDNNMRVSGHKTATAESKNILAQDLRTGNIDLGESLDKIRMTYGDADDIFVSGCVVRLIYRIDADKDVTLWFEDGKQLSMWSN